jgi:hypothetical protein
MGRRGQVVSSALQTCQRFAVQVLWQQFGSHLSQAFYSTRFKAAVGTPQDEAECPFDQPAGANRSINSRRIV